MVEAAVREYIDNAPRDQVQHSLREEIAEKAERHVGWLLDMVGRLDWALLNEAEMTREHLKAAAQSLLSEQRRADSFLPSERRKRLQSRLAIAWTGPGKGKISISDGPLARFISTVFDYVPDAKPFSASGAKRFLAEIEAPRRELLKILSVGEPWSVQSGMAADPYLIDGFGRRKE
jgi:hypothetical protein